MASDEPDDSRLIRLYRRYLGEPVARTDLFIGFALFFGGLAVGAIGLTVYLASGTVAPGTHLYWYLREIAIVLAFLGLPAFILSIVVLLPVAERATYASLGGAAVCGIAVGVFVTTYPQAWNVPGRDYSPIGIMIYAGGLAILVASTGAALVAHHLERRQPVSPSGDPEPSTPEQGAHPDPVTAAEVEQDIASAVAAADLTWGGVEKPKTRRLELQPERTADLDTSGFDSAGPAASSTTGETVDAAVEGLRKLRGWDPETATGQDVDEQTAALRALRETAEADEPDEDASRLAALLGRFRGD